MMKVIFCSSFIVVFSVWVDTRRHADIFDNSPHLQVLVRQMAVYFAMTGDIMFLLPVRRVCVSTAGRGVDNISFSCVACLPPHRLSAPTWSHPRSTSCFAMPPVHSFLS